MIIGRSTINKSIKRSIIIKRGDTFELELYYKKDGLIQDLTNQTIVQSQVRLNNNISSRLIKQLHTRVDTKNDKIILYLPASDNDFIPGRYYYDIEIYHNENNITIYEGSFTVLPEVTSWKKPYESSTDISFSNVLEHQFIPVVSNLNSFISNKIEYEFIQSSFNLSWLEQVISYEHITNISLTADNLLTNEITYNTADYLMSSNTIISSEIDYTKDISGISSSELTTEITYGILYN